MWISPVYTEAQNKPSFAKALEGHSAKIHAKTRESLVKATP